MFFPFYKRKREEHKFSSINANKERMERNSIKPKIDEERLP